MPEATLHFVQANRLLRPALRYYSQVMKVFHQFLIAPEREDNARFPSFLVNDELLSRSSHRSATLLSKALFPPLYVMPSDELLGLPNGFELRLE